MDKLKASKRLLAGTLRTRYSTQPRVVFASIRLPVYYDDLYKKPGVLSLLDSDDTGDRLFFKASYRERVPQPVISSGEY